MAKKSSYDAHKEDVRQRNAEKAAEGREVGPLPEIVCPERREFCQHSLEQFATEYFSHRFPLAFSEMHRRSLDKMARCITEGGLFAVALPRGSGKTTIAEVAVIWALAYGFRRFVVLVAATEYHATEALKRIQAEIETNDILLEDFPEVCYCIRRLERINNRARGQTLGGEPTRIEWTADGIRFPRINKSKCSGSIIRVAGITGAIRGLQVLDPDGGILRPDLVIADDAQTRDSAESPTQTEKRENILTGDILGLAGPTTQIAAFNLCTVICPNDLSDRTLSTDRHPEWQGIRENLMPTFPSAMELWEDYALIRKQSFRDGDEGKAGTQFYLENRDKMDAGAMVTWPERIKKGEISAIQGAMNLYLDNPRGFRAEYQNLPDKLDSEKSDKQLEPATVYERINGHPQYFVPEDCSRITAFIDCGGELLWYCVTAWTEHFGGHVIDYGCYPRQSRHVFEASDPKPGMSAVFPNLREEERVYAGLKVLTNEILGRKYQRAGVDMSIDRCLIDSGWHSKTVYDFVKASQFERILFPSKGAARSLTKSGVGQWKLRPGEREGWNWKLTAGDFHRLRLIQFDADSWKTFIYNSLISPKGGRFGINLFGKSKLDHELFANHCASEYSMIETIRGITFDKWHESINRPDNHLWDCLIGTAVAASVTGLVWQSSDEKPSKPQEASKRSYSEIQREKQQIRDKPTAGGPRKSFMEMQAEKMKR